MAHRVRQEVWRQLQRPRRDKFAAEYTAVADSANLQQRRRHTARQAMQPIRFLRCCCWIF